MTTRPTTSRTRRGEGFASAGAVRQHGGSLPVYVCNACGDEVVWAESKRTGRKYLVTVRTGYHGQRFYVGSDLHPRDCVEQRAARVGTVDRPDARQTQIATFRELLEEDDTISAEVRTTVEQRLAKLENHE